jgi:hypothetical protein
MWTMHNERPRESGNEESGVTRGPVTSTTASNDGYRPAIASCATALKGSVAYGTTNNSALPTAPNVPDASPLHPIRRHSGKPLGCHGALWVESLLSCVQESGDRGLADTVWVLGPNSGNQALFAHRETE